LVFTEFSLMPVLTAVENVELPLIWGSARDRQRAVGLLEAVGLGHRLTHRPTELSGGEMQRVALARALINQPLVLLADEPTGRLESQARDEIIDLFNELRREALPTIIATHGRKQASRCDRLLELRDGRLVT
jgi:putative ABC transport system ATP-binding protein